MVLISTAPVWLLGLAVFLLGAALWAGLLWLGWWVAATVLGVALMLFSTVWKAFTSLTPVWAGVAADE